MGVSSGRYRFAVPFILEIRKEKREKRNESREKKSASGVSLLISLFFPTARDDK
jgi:hypothetical protein